MNKQFAPKQLELTAEKIPESKSEPAIDNEPLLAVLPRTATELRQRLR